MLDLTHIHPMIVHFPIALLLVGFMSDLIGLVTRRAFFNHCGFYLLILGTVGVVAAYLSGEYAGDGMPEAGAMGQALELHESAAELTLWLVSGTALVRIAAVLLKKYKGVVKAVALLLFLVGVLSVARTGYYGGELVFKHAAGVQLDLGIDFGALGGDDVD
ncbi:DUF2231 domain-containing protein [Pontiella agarivorans]|uniref:DUF2231 domain-containing protein n=1 Tax=Pontiella agarivorans TaxID=3038953 RepID=A0ABU5MZT0_9BACT|nr:DUF2231 domain-containing protein [Pontiella agarivorans]MDZ8119707.1 hypothetical protein [Pontiella agarivorans]